MALVSRLTQSGRGERHVTHMTGKEYVFEHLLSARHFPIYYHLDKWSLCYFSVEFNNIFTFSKLFPEASTTSFFSSFYYYRNHLRTPLNTPFPLLTADQLGLLPQSSPQYALDSL